MTRPYLAYQQFQPSPHLRPFVECFWTLQVDGPCEKRTIPDGCVDLLFSWHRGSRTAFVAGAMTRPHDLTLADGRSFLGMRFRPGMASLCLGIDAPALNDRLLKIERLNDPSIGELARRIDTITTMADRLEALERHFAALPPVTQTHAAISALVGRQGQMSADALATLAGVGRRQLQRVCAEHCGLSPKHLARIIRFRHAAALLRGASTDLPAVAIGAGYFDQSHMNRDFRELAAMTPAEYARVQIRAYKCLVSDFSKPLESHASTVRLG